MATNETSNANKTSEVNIATETAHTPEEEAKRHKKESLLRQKRDLILKTTQLGRDLSIDDEEKENLGIEEVMLLLLSFFSSNRLFLKIVACQKTYSFPYCGILSVHNLCINIISSIEFS